MIVMSAFVAGIHALPANPKISMAGTNGWPGDMTKSCGDFIALSFIARLPAESAAEAEIRCANIST